MTRSIRTMLFLGFCALTSWSHAIDYSAIEDATARAALPEFIEMPAASAEELTPGRKPRMSAYRGWTRSHGGHTNARFYPGDLITKENVAQLQVVWEYRSDDGAENVQCNSIIVDGVLFTPTSGEHLVALDAARGKELWRFKPGGRPAFRGLTYWKGDKSHPARLLFSAGPYLYALLPKDGTPIPGFGDEGRVRIGESRVAGAVYKHVFILPMYARDVLGLDVRTGKQLWVFHTIPEQGEFGFDTWSAPSEGANCWGGMALDDRRGIAYFSTGSPKPNFAGNTHTGDNLFANCVVALDALTGERRWHFQELRHDIWDLDIPAAPNLVTILKDGKRVDAVAQVTKLGNAFLLDRLTGKPLYPVRLRRAPTSLLPGEITSPYQPDLQLPERFARQEFTLEDVTTRTSSAHDFIIDKIKGARFGWSETFEENRPTVLYNIHGGAEWTGAAFNPKTGHLFVSANNVPWIVTVFRPDELRRATNVPPSRGEVVYQENCAQCHGIERFGVGMYPPLHGLARRHTDASVRALLDTGKGAMPPAPDTVTEADRQALLDFLFLRDVPPGDAAPKPDGPIRYTHNGYPKLLDDEGYPGCKPPWGTLNSIDLNTGKLAWQVPLGTYPDLAAWGETDTGAENFGGPSVCAGGVVFCAGTPDEKIYAFDAETGAVLWEHQLPFGGYAPPTIYEIDGKPYVVIAATGGGKLDTTRGDAYVAFSFP